LYEDILAIIPIYDGKETKIVEIIRLASQSNGEFVSDAKSAQSPGKA
jgi:hypothetical protein